MVFAVPLIGIEIITIKIAHALGSQRTGIIRRRMGVMIPIIAGTADESRGGDVLPIEWIAVCFGDVVKRAATGHPTVGQPATGHAIRRDLGREDLPQWLLFQ